MGARAIDLTPEDGRVTFAIVEPTPLDRDRLARVFATADYEIRDVTVRVRGEVVDGPAFLAADTSDALPLRGGPELGWTGEIALRLDPDGAAVAID